MVEAAEVKADHDLRPIEAAPEEDLYGVYLVGKKRKPTIEERTHTVGHGRERRRRAKKRPFHGEAALFLPGVEGHRRLPLPFLPQLIERRAGRMPGDAVSPEVERRSGLIGALTPVGVLGDVRVEWPDFFKERAARPHVTGRGIALFRVTLLVHRIGDLERLDGIRALAGGID